MSTSQNQTTKASNSAGTALRLRGVRKVYPMAEEEVVALDQRSTAVRA